VILSSSFSRTGLGIYLGALFDAAVKGYVPTFLDRQRGQQLLITCDIGGSQRNQRYETFAFLVLDLDRNSWWLRKQRQFRSLILPPPRRMAFKAMNDGVRRRALGPFLRLANEIDGLLVTFAIEKIERPNFDLGDDFRRELGAIWKAVVADRLLWVLHLCGFLVSGLASAGQDVMFIIDQDEVAANVMQLTKLTELFGRICSNQPGPMIGHLRCGTTKSDDGSLAIEDLAAIPDLAAGAVGEFTAIMQRHGRGPLSRIIQQLPSGMTWKTREIMLWICNDDAALARITCIIDSIPAGGTWRATTARWHITHDV